MKSVLHAEVLAALRRVASVPCVRLEGRDNRRLHILVLWTLEVGGEVVLKRRNLLEGSLVRKLGVRHEAGRHRVNQKRPHASPSCDKYPSEHARCTC